MEIDHSPTKGNLMRIEKTLKLSKSGHDLMDRKRLILTNEIVSLVEQAKTVQSQLTKAYEKAYNHLKLAEESVGLFRLSEISDIIPVDDQINIKERSIMGSEIPKIEKEDRQANELPYSLNETSVDVDRTRIAFEEVKKLQIKLAEIETTAYRLANNLQKTQKRVNALQNVTIPQLESAQIDINNKLEEKEREEFTRMKAVKRILGEKEELENEQMQEV